MARSIEALITPKVIKWAREKSGYSISAAADIINVSAQKLQGWENGESLPTIIQARKLANTYKRPFAMFYMDEPPVEFDTLKDFRKLPLSEDRLFSPILCEIIRNLREHQEWLNEYLVSQDFNSIKYIGKYTVNDDPISVADSIFELFSINRSIFKKYRSRSELLKKWIEVFEANSIFVTRSSKVELEECRGMMLIDEIAPIIFINTQDAEAGQLFTLIHEFVHLLLGQSAIINSKVRGNYMNPEFDIVEVFCNKVAAFTLLDNNDFINSIHLIKDNLAIEDKIQQLSSMFIVSEEVIARRMLDIGLIDEIKYLELREKYNARWNAIYAEKRRKMKENKGGPSYYIRQLSYNGKAFSGIVLNAYYGNRISCRNASNLLNMKVNNLNKMAEVLGMGYLR